MIEKILFGTDFSTISERAQQYVLQMASAMGASVILVHAIEPPQGVDLENDKHFTRYVDNLRVQAEKRAETVVAAFKEAGVECKLEMPLDKRWKAIVDVSQEQDVDLIVIGSHTISENGKLYLGTTSHKVFFSTDKPFMVVPQG